MPAAWIITRIIICQKNLPGIWAMSILIISLENTFFLHNRLPGLQRIETIVQSVPISPISSFVCDSHLMRLGTSVAIKGPIERHHQVHGLFRFPEFYLISLFAAPGPRAGHLVIISPDVPLVGGSVSNCPCLWRPWQFWGAPVRSVIQCLSVGICLMLSP